jgi:hypothetical protein
MRNAQNDLLADDLRRMSRERQRMVTDLVKHARTLAASAGIAISGAVEREVTATLEAAVADDTASRALRAGRLTTSLSYSGFGPTDLIPSPAAGQAEPPQENESPTPDRSANHESPRDDPARTQRRKDIEKARQVLGDRRHAAALLRAEAEARRTDAGRLARLRDSAHDRHQQLLEAISDLEVELGSARDGERDADRRLADALALRESAERRAEAAAVQVSEHEEHLSRLQDDQDPQE